MSRAKRKQAAVEKAQQDRMRHVVAVAAVLVVVAVAMTAAYLGMQSNMSEQHWVIPPPMCTLSNFSIRRVVPVRCSIQWSNSG
jgi:type VI protein secretion system component VasF